MNYSTGTNLETLDRNEFVSLKEQEVPKDEISKKDMATALGLSVEELLDLDLAQFCKLAIKHGYTIKVCGDGWPAPNGMISFCMKDSYLESKE